MFSSPKNPTRNKLNDANPLISLKKDKTKLSRHELRRLSELIYEDKERCVFDDDQLPCIILKFDENTYVAMSRKLGNGFWGVVHLGKTYIKNHDGEFIEGDKCVVKELLEDNAFKNTLHHWLNVVKKMQEEAALVNQMHGIGSALRIKREDNNKDKIYLHLPFLGELSLKSLLEQPELLATISLSEWLRFFMLLTQQLQKLHHHTKKLHNDIKPENIGLTMSEGKFSQINFYDLGNAHKIGATGAFGDPKYQAPESFLGVAFSGIKSEKIDVYSLGKTFLEAINIILQYNQNDFDNKAYQSCKALFDNMSSLLPFHRPVLNQCMETLKKIAATKGLEFNFSEKEVIEKEEISEEESDLDEKQFVMVDSSQAIKETEDFSSEIKPIASPTTPTKNSESPSQRQTTTSSNLFQTAARQVWQAGSLLQSKSTSPKSSPGLKFGGSSIN